MDSYGLSHDLWQFKHGLYAVAFLTAGGLYWRYEKMLKKVISKKIVAIMLIIYLALFSLWSKDLRVLISMLDVNWLGYIAGCYASILLIELCKYLPKISILTYIGQNSISFYFMSGALPIVTGMIANHLMAAPRWYDLIVVWLSSIFLACIMTYMLNRYASWVFDMRLLVNTKLLKLNTVLPLRRKKINN